MANPSPVEIQQHLGGIDYPASKDRILRTARDNGADGNVLDALESLPDRDYDGPTAVSEALAP